MCSSDLEELSNTGLDQDRMKYEEVSNTGLDQDRMKYEEVSNTGLDQDRRVTHSKVDDIDKRILTRSILTIVNSTSSFSLCTKIFAITYYRG